jgi:hypothetical protein
VLLVAGFVAILLFAFSFLWMIVRLIRGAFSKLLVVLTLLLLVIGGGSLWLARPAYSLQNVAAVPNYAHVYIATVRIGSAEQRYLEQDAVHILTDVQTRFPQARGIQIKFQEQVGTHLRVLPMTVEWAPGGDWNAALAHDTSKPYQIVFLYGLQ